jgi:hypothetical protein
VNVSANNSNNKRSFSITVSTVDNSIRKTVTLEQSGSSYYVNILGNKAISLPRVASTANVIIAVNQDWEAQATEPWLSVEPFMGSVASVGTRETQEVTVSVVGNSSRDPRVGNIVFTVRNSDGSVAYTETLIVTQGSINAPQLTLPEVFDVNTNSARLFSTFHGAESQGVITGYGFYWGTSPDNLTNQNHVSVPVSQPYGYEGSLEAQLEGLEPLTTYYVVAYAVNEQGMGLSQVQTFTTAGATPQEDDNNTPGL